MSIDGDIITGEDSSTFDKEKMTTYWKERCERAEKLADEYKEELDEFQTSSKELECELELQLEQSEKKVIEYRSLSNSLQMENGLLQDKLKKCQGEYNAQIASLQSELSEIKSFRDTLRSHVRGLEQQNDDLERAKRNTIASLEDFEEKFNSAIERNAFLESELDEKETLKAAVYRMKEETRDLRTELNLTTQSCRKQNENNDQQDDKTSEESNSNQRTTSVSKVSSKPLPNSTRISALNIVSDLLRKVGALEMKVASRSAQSSSSSSSNQDVVDRKKGENSSSWKINRPFSPATLRPKNSLTKSHSSLRVGVTTTSQPPNAQQQQQNGHNG